MNDSQKKFSWKARGRSFKYAWRGIKGLIIGEHNARIHCVMALLVIIAGIILKISSSEWCLVLICMGAVLMAEAMNSAVEALADHACSEFNPLIGKAKDMAAGGVLLIAITSATVGLIIFLPKIFNFFSGLF